MAVTDVPYTELVIRAEPGLLDSFDQAYVETKIEDAVALIVDECPTVPARLLSGALSPSNYRRVVYDVVMRVIRNPAGLTSEAEGGYSYNTSAAVASGDFWLSPRDRRTLLGLRSPGGAGSISIGIDKGWS